MTRDEKLVHAFLVADDFLTRNGPAPPTVVAGLPWSVDSRMPLGVVAIYSPNGSIVVKEIAT